MLGTRSSRQMLLQEGRKESGGDGGVSSLRPLPDGRESDDVGRSARAAHVGAELCTLGTELAAEMGRAGGTPVSLGAASTGILSALGPRRGDEGPWRGGKVPAWGGGASNASCPVREEGLLLSSCQGVSRLTSPSSWAGWVGRGSQSLAEVLGEFRVELRPGLPPATGHRQPAARVPLPRARLG